jgi:diphthamide biosynthesis protein 4
LITVKLESPQTPTDYYQVLSIPQNACIPEIKAAYHRALLQHHPDKQQSLNGSTTSIEISLIKEAYETLVSSEKRAQYDTDVLKGKRKEQRLGSSGPRPAQVVSLEEWTSLAASGEEDDEGPWMYPCRCSGHYEISVEMMERGVHLVGCNSCSEVVWAGYELEEESG